MENFENPVLEMTRKLEVRHYSNNFQTKLSTDTQKLKSEDKPLVKAEKSR